MNSTNFKFISILGILFCLVAIVLTSCVDSIEERDLKTKKSEISTSLSANDKNNLNDYVDEQLRNIIESDSYKKASIDERKDIINQLLTQLKKDNAINYFSYSKDSYLFSFEYSDGSLGGVRLKDFDTEFNGVPIG